METKAALTSEAIALTEKKMDMALDDIIKMSKKTSNKTKNRRPSNKTERFSNGLGYQRNAKVQHFLDSRSSIRQGVLALRRSNFQGARFQLAKEAAKKTVVAPIPIRNNIIRNRGANWNKPRVAVVAVRKNTAESGFVSGRAKRGLLPKQRPQTLDSLFANMKEERMWVQQMRGGQNTRRLGGLQQQRGARAGVQQRLGGLQQQRGARAGVQQRLGGIHQQRGARAGAQQRLGGLQQQRVSRANGVQQMRGGQNTR